MITILFLSQSYFSFNCICISYPRNQAVRTLVKFINTVATTSPSYRYNIIVYLSMKLWIFSNFVPIQIICWDKFLWGGGKYTGVELAVVYFALVSPIWTWFSGAAPFCCMQGQLHLESWRALCVGGWNYQKVHSLPIWWYTLAGGPLQVVSSWGHLASSQLADSSKKSIPGRITITIYGLVRSHIVSFQG